MTLSLLLALLERGEERGQIPTARDRRGEPRELRVQAAGLREDLVASSLGGVAARAQFVDCELDRSLNDLGPEQIALDRGEHRVVRNLHRRFQPLYASILVNAIWGRR